MENPYFWSAIKANVLTAGCSILLTVIVAVVVGLLRRRSMKKISANHPGDEKERGPQMYIFGGEKPKPQHCPLCGRHWLLPGPVLPKPPTEQK